MSKVPTANDASVRAWNARGFLDAISSWNVTALLRIAKDDETLGLAGSFVWEVRLTTSRGEGGATESVAWVGTQTGKVKIFP